MLIGTENIDLQLTLLDSAQCFAWSKYKNGYIAVLNGSAVFLHTEDEKIIADGAESDYMRRYLDLDRDYAEIGAEYAGIPNAKRAFELYPGLRILNQDAWDALFWAILSANNNVGRIRKLADSLSRNYGDACEFGCDIFYGFPKPEKLAACSEEELRALGVGYRAPYLVKTARMICDGFPLYQLKDMPYDEAHAMLLRLYGVGDKVADCVLLFGCGHASAFPVDVWVERLLKSWFGIEEKDRRKQLAAARSMLGKHGGILQQYLFHAARMGDIEL